MRSYENLRAATVRSGLMLEVAAELVGAYDWPQKQALISLREQGGQGWGLSLFASDAPGTVDQVVNGEVQIGIVNPEGVLAMAYRGTGPFPEPLPVRAITVIPQFDQLGFAVAGRTGLSSLRELAEKRYPLKLSLRGQRDHSVHLITNQVLSTLGFTLDDITSWGGEVRYTSQLPNGPDRLGAVERGEIEAIFDEAMPTFGARALDLGMRFLPLDEGHLSQLEQIGLQRVAITNDEYPGLGDDVWTVDFSGWPIFTREDLDDSVVRAFCAALEARKDRIPWYGTGPLPLDKMCRDTRDGRLTVPLHRAAEQFWREQGYL
jgi:TRAP-type uncharacterized transport system substrate-binding protein